MKVLHVDCEDELQDIVDRLSVYSQDPSFGEPGECDADTAKVAWELLCEVELESYQFPAQIALPDNFVEIVKYAVEDMEESCSASGDDWHSFVTTLKAPSADVIDLMGGTTFKEEAVPDFTDAPKAEPSLTQASALKIVMALALDMRDKIGLAGKGPTPTLNAALTIVAELVQELEADADKNPVDLAAQFLESHGYTLDGVSEIVAEKVEDMAGATDDEDQVFSDEVG
jgi:hypothetical protein